MGDDAPAIDFAFAEEALLHENPRHILNEVAVVGWQVIGFKHQLAESRVRRR